MDSFSATYYSYVSSCSTIVRFAPNGMAPVTVQISKRYSETIEHRWDILYRDYPEVYERFASFPYTPPWISLVTNRFDLDGNEVVDNSASLTRDERLAPP